jgi:hypothetical protein
VEEQREAIPRDDLPDQDEERVKPDHEGLEEGGAVRGEPPDQERHEGQEPRTQQAGL